MTKGKVKWYNDTKGFGFIETEETDDIFMHRSGIVDNYPLLQQDDEVEFETRQGDRGIMAVNVKRLA
mgnify:CR=1 FL=1